MDETTVESEDLQEIFDDRDIQELFSSSSERSELSTATETPQQHSMPTPLQAQPQYFKTVSSTHKLPSVNLQMIIDPVSGRATYPRQVLTYDVGYGKFESVVFGPLTLETIRQDAKPLNSATNHPSTSATVAPPFEVKQHQHHSAFSTTISPYASANVGVNTAIFKPEGLSIPVLSCDSRSGTTPVRALSAYNWFFRDERDRILNGGKYEWTQEKQARLLASYWHQDRSKKRRHRKTHGKINFTTLSRLVSQRWNELNPSQKQFYRQVAAQDFQRYQREMEEYKKKLEASASPFLSFCQLVA
jgi:hypothetical protein